MIINELAYKVTIKADEFLNGKKKVSDEVAKLEKDFDRTGKNVNRTLKTSATDFTQFGNAAVSSFRGVTAAAAGFLDTLRAGSFTSQHRAAQRVLSVT